jgi:hypothetical protein
MPTRPVSTGRDMSTAGERASQRAVTGAPGPDEEAAVAASTARTTTVGRATSPGVAHPATVGTATTAGAGDTATTGPEMTAGSAGTATAATADHSTTVTVTDRTLTRQRPTLGTPTS